MESKLTYKKRRSYENFQKMIFPGTGSFGIPKIEPIEYSICERWIPFNYAASEKQEQRKEIGIHFFIDDYQFGRVWSHIDNYTPMLSEFKYVTAPDYSLFADYPRALQIYNHYRKHWVAAYLQTKGIQVIPTICWSTPDNYSWCFDGEPAQSTIAVSAIGTQNSGLKMRRFMEGYQEMNRRLQPEKILFYGEVPKECLQMEGGEKIQKIEAFRMTRTT